MLVGGALALSADVLRYNVLKSYAILGEWRVGRQGYVRIERRSDLILLAPSSGGKRPSRIVTGNSLLPRRRQARGIAWLADWRCAGSATLMELPPCGPHGQTMKRWVGTKIWPTGSRKAGQAQTNCGSWSSSLHRNLQLSVLRVEDGEVSQPTVEPWEFYVLDSDD
jgi:hypothetical protein